MYLPLRSKFRISILFWGGDMAAFSESWDQAKAFSNAALNLFMHYLFITFLQVCLFSNLHGKRVGDMEIGKEKVKFSVFVNDTIL